MFSVWEQLTNPEAFCNPGCSSRCRADCSEGGEDDELDEDAEFTRILYDPHRLPADCLSSQDESVPADTALSSSVVEVDGLKKQISGGRNPGMKFSLPWADLNGNKKDSLVTSSKAGLAQSQSRSHSPTTSLLPFSRGSTGRSFNSLYRPEFVTGIPTKAYAYKPNMADGIDVEVQKALRILSPEASQLFALRCIEPGKYEVEGRTVDVYWGINGLLVHENVGDGLSIGDMPLQDYINLAAAVAMDLQRLAKNDTFLTNGVGLTHDPMLSGDQRYEAMQIACMQAKMRKDEAEKQWS